MVLPLYDHSPFKWPTPPYVTWLLIAVNVIVFLAQIATTTGAKGMRSIRSLRWSRRRLVPKEFSRARRGRR